MLFQQGRAPHKQTEPERAERPTWEIHRKHGYAATESQSYYHEVSMVMMMRRRMIMMMVIIMILGRMMITTTIMTMMTRVTERSGSSVDFTSTHEFRASPSSSTPSILVIITIIIIIIIGVRAAAEGLLGRGAGDRQYGSRYQGVWVQEWILA